MIRSPADLPSLPPGSFVSVDTEASGLFVDEGARLSVVSLAWWPSDPLSTSHPGISPQEVVFAWDQGEVTPLGAKPPTIRKKAPRKRATQSLSLFDELPVGDAWSSVAPNLSPGSFADLIDWLLPLSLVYHNSKYDLHILMAGLRNRPDVAPSRLLLPQSTCWDTLVNSVVIWPEFRSALKPTAERLWPDQDHDGPDKAMKAWLAANFPPKAPRYDLAPWDIMLPYAKHDAGMTLSLFERQLQEIEEGTIDSPATLRRVCERENDFALVLQAMETRGVGYDTFAARVACQALEVEIARARDSLHRAIRVHTPRLAPPNPTFVNEHTMRKVWYAPTADGGLGLTPQATTEEGKPSVTIEVVRALASTDPPTPCAAQYAELNKLTNAHSMWYGTWFRLVSPIDGRLRTSYKQSRSMYDKGEGGTISGRLSVQRVQLQAIPHNYQLPPGLTPVRDFFIPKPGHRLWELDLSQAEMRTAASVSRCAALIAGFERGEDAHDMTTVKVFNLAPGHPDWKHRRNISKRLNFGMVYGAGAHTIGRQIEIFTGVTEPVHLVEQWLADFRKAFPELPRSARQAEWYATKRRHVDLAGGRKRWFSPYEETRKAFNAKIQGGVAETMKDAQIEIEVQYPGIQLLQIHDSVIIEPPASSLDEESSIVVGCQKIMADTFERAFGLPFVVDAKLWGNNPPLEETT